MGGCADQSDEARARAYRAIGRVFTDCDESAEISHSLDETRRVICRKVRPKRSSFAVLERAVRNWTNGRFAHNYL